VATAELVEKISEPQDPDTPPHKWFDLIVVASPDEESDQTRWGHGPVELPRVRAAIDHFAPGKARVTRLSVGY
jgi:hypothetical protein